MGIEHRTTDASPGELLEILERDGGVIVEGCLLYTSDAADE